MHILAGQVEPKGPSVVDFAWLTKEEIKDRLVAEYGPDVLAVPEAEGFDLAAWLVPGAAILAAAAAIFVGLRRWRRDSGGNGPNEPPPPAAPTGADAERLEADLARYGP